MKSLCFSCFIKSTKALRIIASVSVFGILLLSSFVINPVYISIDKAEGTTGTATESTTSLTLASTATDASIVLTPGAGFTLSSASNTSSYDVTTNNYTGYTITLTSEDNDKTLVHTVDNTKVISSINTPIAETDFVSTTPALMNHFGIKPNKYYDTENNTTIDNTVSSTILPAPGTTGLILDKTTSSNSTANNYSIALGAMVDGTIPAGDYTRDLNLVAIANPVAYRVIFNKNTNDIVSNMPTEYSGSTSTTGINIPNTIPERTGYTFAGWCNRKDTLNTCPTGGVTYQPNGVYGIDQTSQNEVTLYAIWQPNYYMQDVAIWGKTLSIGQSMQAIDRRDNKIYWVTKEETDPANPRAEIDETTGKAFQIWMTQNLDLDLDSTRTYTHADTDLGYTTNNTLATWQPARSTIANDALNASTWQSDNYTPYSYDGGNAYIYTSNDATTDNNNADTLYNSLYDCSASNSSVDCSHYHVGNYYNWSAAVASNNTTGVNTNYSNAQDSICPAGWRLPTGLTSASGYSDFAYLLNKAGVISSDQYGTESQILSFTEQGLNNYRNEPLWFARPGFLKSQNSAMDSVGIVGDYWMSTTKSSSWAYFLESLSTLLRTANVYDRYYGFSVRCIARVPTMQSVDEWGDSLAVGESRQAVDMRDNKMYWATKLETDPANPRAHIDPETGKAYQIWMTQNLDYDLKTTEALIPETSDVMVNTTPLRDTIATGSLSSSNWQASQTSPYSYDPGDNYTYMNSSYIDSHYRGTKAECIAEQGAYACSHYQSGNLYNWTAATGLNDSSEIATAYSRTKTSICPAGWRLPSGPGNDLDVDDQAYLLTWNNITSSPGNTSGGTTYYTTNGLALTRKAPLYIAFAGEQYDTNLSDPAGGSYWADSVYSSSAGYAFYTQFAMNMLRPMVAWTRVHDFSVRCVARTSINDLTTMQEFAALDSREKENVVKHMEVGKQYELQDSRDDKNYTIAKLPDGTVWMTKSLDLAGGTTVTQENSNVSTSFTLPESSRHGFYDNDIAFVYNSGSTTCGEDSPCYSYYSYAAATAGTNPSSGDASYDICPKGWRLPTKNEAISLTSMYTNGDAMTASPWYGKYSRYLGDEYMADGEARGYFWSSAVAETNAMYAYWYGFGTSSSDVGRGYKATGIPIRCILDTTSIEKVTTMQSFASLTPIQRKNTLESMVGGKQYTIKDARDNKEYTISRLGDGTVWMTSNLDLAGGTALYSDTSNVPAGYPTGGTPFYTLVASSTATTVSDSTTATLYNSNNPTCDGTGPCTSYYNYVSVTAGTNPTEGDAIYDICPKGWRLPVDTEYNRLAAIYPTGAEIVAGPWKGVYAGYYGHGTYYYESNRGLFWTSSMVPEANTARMLDYYTGTANTWVNGSYKYNAFPVRCVLNMNLQDTTNDTLDLLIPTSGKSITVSDARDGEKYTIGRLADGNVWLLDNLRLGSASAISLTPDDTNIADSWSLPASVPDVGYNSPAQTKTVNKNTVASYGSGSSRMGNYYNTCAASAGKICGDTNSESIAYDICPKGWRMPAGYTEGDYYKLYKAYNKDDSAFKEALHVVFSGWAVGSDIIGEGTAANLLSTTPYDSNGMFSLYITETEMNARTNGAYRMHGLSVRCIKSN